MDEVAKKEALRLFTYGLYAITTGDEQQRNAFTANWVSQVSFDPPLVVLSIENDSVSLPIIRRTGLFAVNVYASDQRDLAGLLGKTFDKHPEKLEGVVFATGETGCPVLSAGLAYVECRVRDEMLAGDSTLLLAQVEGATVLRRAEPLTMLAAGFKHAG
ncbi:MAG TPA: flavin reductase family protein [Ktedonobacterales bacterium]|jgi:flavin reductase (DIM6/NTAB) family NADH-FMN oxidoreductase RutF